MRILKIFLNHLTLMHLDDILKHSIIQYVLTIWIILRDYLFNHASSTIKIWKNARKVDLHSKCKTRVQKLENIRKEKKSFSIVAKTGFAQCLSYESVKWLNIRCILGVWLCLHVICQIMSIQISIFRFYSLFQ